MHLYSLYSDVKGYSLILLQYLTDFSRSNEANHGSQLICVKTEPLQYEISHVIEHYTRLLCLWHRLHNGALAVPAVFSMYFHLPLLYFQ